MKNLPRTVPVSEIDDMYSRMDSPRRSMNIFQQLGVKFISRKKLERIMVWIPVGKYPYILLEYEFWREILIELSFGNGKFFKNCGYIYTKLFYVR